MELETTRTANVEENTLTQQKEGCSSSERTDCLGVTEQAFTGRNQIQALNSMVEGHQALD